MNAPAYDTLGAVRGLREAGFEEVQAEAIVITVGRAMSENVATKSDIAGVNANTAEFRADVDSKFAGVDSRFANVDSRFASVDSQFAAVRTEMAGLRAYVAEEFKALYRHLWVMGVGIVAVTVTLVKLVV